MPRTKKKGEENWGTGVWGTGEGRKRIKNRINANERCVIEDFLFPFRKC
jgi:hypothetical protein